MSLTALKGKKTKKKVTRAMCGKELRCGGETLKSMIK